MKKYIIIALVVTVLIAGLYLTMKMINGQPKSQAKLPSTNNYAMNKTGSAGIIKSKE